MGEGGVHTEGSSSSGSASNKGRWGWFKNLWRRPHSIPAASEETNQPNMPEGAGFRDLVNTIRVKEDPVSDSVARILEDEYPNLISTVTQDTRIPEEIKKALIDGINNGDKEVIPVIAARLLEKTKNGNKSVSRSTSNNQLVGRQALVATLEEYFLVEQVSRDESDRSDDIKFSWARNALRLAINSPHWLPGLTTPVPPGLDKGFAPNALDPNIKPPQPPK